MIDVLVWNKYTRVVMQLAERLNISPEKALHLFYNSKVYPKFKSTFLLM